MISQMVLKRELRNSGVIGFGRLPQTTFGDLGQMMIAKPNDAFGEKPWGNLPHVMATGQPSEDRICPESLCHRADDEAVIPHGQRGQAAGGVGLGPAVREFEGRIWHKQEDSVSELFETDRAWRLVSSKATCKSGNVPSTRADGEKPTGPEIAPAIVCFS